VTVARVGIAVLVVGVIVLLGGLSVAYRRASDPYAAADIECRAVGASRGEAAYQRCIDEDVRSGPFDVSATWLTGVGIACLVIGGIWIALGGRLNRTANPVADVRQKGSEPQAARRHARTAPRLRRARVAAPQSPGKTLARQAFGGMMSSNNGFSASSPGADVTDNLAG
jgi:hypothetical protein